MRSVLFPVRIVDYITQLHFYWLFQSYRGCFSRNQRYNQHFTMNLLSLHFPFWI
jgi:hypothetical protein